MLSMGSKCIAWLSCVNCRFADRGTGDGAKLANWGSGENVKFGENGRARPLPFEFGSVSELFCRGGVYGGIDASVPTALVSHGLGLESDVPASERLCGIDGCVAEVGVGSGGACCDCDVAGFEVVARRFLFGWPLAYCACCEGTDCFWKPCTLPITPLVMYILFRCSILKVARLLHDQ